MANATVTVKASGGDYTTLNAALAGEAADLTANCHSTGGAGILTIECYSMSDTTAANTGTGYTTSADYYINIIVPVAERHVGKWNASKYNLTINVTGDSQRAFLIQEAYTRVTGVQIALTNDTGDYQPIAIFQSAGGDALIQSCIIKGTGDDGEYACGVCSTSGNLNLYNTLIYDFTGSSAQGIYLEGSTINILNCTIVNCDYGINRGGGTVYVKNCGITGCSTAIVGTVTETTNSTSAPTFVDADNDDYHLGATDVTWHDQGTDLSGTFTTDIDGDTRSTWDIGADEYVAAGGASPVPLFDYYFNNMRP